MAAAGHPAFQTQNRGSLLAAEHEIQGVFAWFSAEMAIDKALPAKLWDGVTWALASDVHPAGLHIPEL